MALVRALEERDACAELRDLLFLLLELHPLLLDFLVGNALDRWVLMWLCDDPISAKTYEIRQRIAVLLSGDNIVLRGICHGCGMRRR